MRIIAFLLFLIVVAFGVSFASLNASPVTVDYYVGQSSMPVSLLMLIVLLVGIIMGLLFSLGLYIRAKRESHHLKSKLKLVNKEVENLRSIPLRD